MNICCSFASHRSLVVTCRHDKKKLSEAQLCFVHHKILQQNLSGFTDLFKNTVLLILLLTTSEVRGMLVVIWSEYVVNVWLTGMVRVPIRLPVQVDRPLSRELQVRLPVQRAEGQATCTESCRSGYLYRELQVRLPVQRASGQATCTESCRSGDLYRELQVKLPVQGAAGQSTFTESCRSGYLYRELQVRLPVLLISTRVTYFLWFYYERQRSSKS